MRRKPNLVRYRLLVAAGAIPLVLFLSSITMHTQADGGGFTPHRLVGVSPEEVGQVALKYTEDTYPNQGGIPRVMLSRAVTEAELPGLGLGSLDLASIEQPPMMLVILKGDFSLTHMLGAVTAGARENQRARYIGYVFDLWAGVPALTITSPQGGVFRKVLDDPSIVVTRPDSPLPPTAEPTPAHKTLHYGETAPPVALPPIGGNK